MCVQNFVFTWRVGSKSLFQSSKQNGMDVLNKLAQMGQIFRHAHVCCILILFRGVDGHRFTDLLTDLNYMEQNSNK